MWRDSESSEDFLNFTEIADQIATLATSSALLPVSIGVFGTWGTGKSTVLRLVESRLEGTNPKPIIIKFDAWLYQGYDDAKAALMEVVAENLLAEVKTNEGLFEKAKRFAGRINYFRALGMAADVGVGMALGVPPGLLTRAGSAIGAILSGQVDGKAATDLKDAGIRRASFDAAGVIDKTPYFDDIRYQRTNDDVSAARIAIARRKGLSSEEFERWVATAGPLPQDNNRRASILKAVSDGLVEVDAFLSGIKWKS